MGSSNLLTGRGSHATRPPTPAAARAVLTPPVVFLSIAAGLLSAVAASVGLLSWGDGAARSVATIRGDSVALLGGRLYQHDTLFVAGNNLSSDLVTLLLAVPLLILALHVFRRGSVRGHLLLLGVLGYLLYHGATYALGAVAYNEAFLLYVAMFSASLFAFVTAFAALDADALVLSPRTPRRFVGGFMLASGVVTLVIWLTEPIAALRTGTSPALLDTYTTLFTHALDLGAIVPATVTAGVLILRRRAFGYVMAMSLLVLEALLMPLITIATIAQVRLGLSFATGEIVGPIAGFTVLAVLAIVVLRAILTNVLEPRSTGGGAVNRAPASQVQFPRARKEAS